VAIQEWHSRLTGSGDWCVVVVTALRGFRGDLGQWGVLPRLQRTLADAVGPMTARLAAPGMLAFPTNVPSGGQATPPYDGDVIECARGITAGRRCDVPRAVGVVLAQDGIDD
jgi:hypothetical protein